MKSVNKGEARCRVACLCSSSSSPSCAPAVRSVRRQPPHARSPGGAAACPVMRAACMSAHSLRGRRRECKGRYRVGYVVVVRLGWQRRSERGGEKAATKAPAAAAGASAAEGRRGKRQMEQGADSPGRGRRGPHAVAATRACNPSS